MDFSLFWKALIIFNFTLCISWMFFYTFRAWFMNDGDFVAPGESARGTAGAKDNADSTFSMSGRSLIFLISILIGLIISMCFFIYYINFLTPSYKCKKGKSLSSCKRVNSL